MNKYLLPFAVLAFSGSLLVGGLTALTVPKAKAVTAATNEISTGLQKVREAIRPVQPSRVARPLPSTRPPVPLLPTRHATYWAEPVEAPSVATADAIPAPDAKAGASAEEARAMIEADGYKRAKVVGKSPDGSWRGLALRGDTEVAVSVDSSGRVSTQ